ncbi:nucleoside triphosphate pyrophosphohydrolase family protein [Gallibacterium anatis]|uniref:nucleoside triphosphate pyrophosphohydrolase family protein n=1 Tax=Gallibacterium anatis TaxID=750 RepID=UPI000531B7BE|nr:nucleoside triphosphate pyrophosphohydrolase family protein [Gallibacterium anatis]KGQ27274.1 phosphoribosyl-ATP pyrophosphohydrolase [Gallibacterium anatis]KGQ28903.1 phosphoribosyl-ATP pyrophosphohydrolase [Gallibacterium anatis]WIM83072.1 nucleoside triphosphate pyrophosphohydrolase family protein [Gallibacterium anatis]
MNNEKNLIKSIENWFKEAKPKPTEKDQAVQIGCHYEEVNEMVLALQNSHDSNLNDLLYANSYHYKKYVNELKLTKSQKIELLDALCDQIVTAVGVAYMLGFDIVGALQEVNDSNWSKFENGKAIFDENGKIKKGKNYFKPNLEKFIQD